MLVSDDGSNPSRYRLNDAVPIRYDPSDPEHAVIDSFNSEWLAPLLLCSVGAVLGLLGFGAGTWRSATLWRTGGLPGASLTRPK